MRGILMYHSVDSSGSPVSISGDEFRNHVRFLATGRVSVVPLSVLPGLPDDRDAVAITFDDGFRSFATTVAPLLAAEGLPATVFVVSDAVGETNDWGGRPAPGIPTLPLMSWQELEAVATAGFDVGAHTRRHPDLTRLPDDQLEDEIVGGADGIAARLGRRPESFAYPYGAVSDAVATVARRAFAWSCTTDFRALAGGEDRALLPRLDAFYLRDRGRLEDWGSPRFRRRLWIRAQGRRVRALIAAAG